MKSIAFNTEDVTAILAGQRTAICRPIRNIPDSTYNIEYDIDEEVWVADYGRRYNGAMLELFTKIRQPRYQQDDIVFVKETYAIGRVDAGELPDGRPEWYISQCPGEDDIIPKEWAISQGIGIEDVTWRPAVNMPLKAARIFLRVDNVYPLYLPEIRQDQIQRMGYKTIEELIEAWDRNLSKKDRVLYRWEKGPWVWVYEFKRVDPEEIQWQQ